MHCTVYCGVRVVVTVICAEHLTIMPAESIVASVTRVPSHLQPVIVYLRQYSERTVFS